jgi:hypothetical protein
MEPVRAAVEDALACADGPRTRVALERAVACARDADYL